MSARAPSNRGHNSDGRRLLRGPGRITLLVFVVLAALLGGSVSAAQALWSRQSAGKTILIGVQAITGGTSSVTGNNLSVGDQLAYARVMARWINHHGGLGGYRVNLVLHPTVFTNYVNNPTAEQQAVCADFTQDHHVFAAITDFASPVMLQCLAARNVIDLESFQSSLDSTYYQKYSSHYYNLGSMSLDAGAVASANALAKQGFFTGGKLGIVYSDDQGAARAEASLKSALKHLNVTVEADAQINPIPSQEASTILRFQQSGIDRVLLVDSTGGLPFTFMNVAQAMHYNPHYGLNTMNNISAVVQIVPAAQLANSLAVSWSVDDVSSASRLTPPRLPSTFVQCATIFAQSGYSFPGPVAQYGAFGYCGGFLFLQKVLKGTHTPTVAAVTKAVNTLGAGFQAPNTYYTTLGKAKHFGATHTRVLAFDTGCSCYQFKALGGEK